jgi:hypothetical protein
MLFKIIDYIDGKTEKKVCKLDEKATLVPFGRSSCSLSENPDSKKEKRKNERFSQEMDFKITL